MLAKDDQIYQVLVLITAVFILCCESKTYKVIDSGEDGPYSFSKDSDSPSAFIFPDYFRNSEEKGGLRNYAGHNLFRSSKAKDMPFTKLYDNFSPQYSAKTTKTRFSSIKPHDGDRKNTNPRKTNYRPSHLTPGPPYEKLPFHEFDPKYKGYYKSVKPVKFTSLGPRNPQENEGKVHHHYFGVKHNYKPQKRDEVDYIIVPKEKYNYSKEKRSNKYTDYPKRRWNVYQTYKNKHPKSSQGFSSGYRSTKNVKAESRKDKDCIKKKFGVPALMNCFICIDEKGQEYEECSLDTTKTKKRIRRNISQIRRNYYENDMAQTYGPDSIEYRFGPEEFEDSDSHIDSENCKKTRKGNMQCIVCETDGRTYEQCSYGSEPKEKSYERSISKVYGSPRLPESRSAKPNFKRVKPKENIATINSYPEIPEYIKTKSLDPYVPEFNYFPTSNKKPFHDFQIFPETTFSEYDIEYPDGQTHISASSRFASTPNRTCKKIKKNGMNCSHCIDENGSTHEDCVSIVSKKPTHRRNQKVY